MNHWDIIIICGVIALIIMAIRLYRSSKKTGGCCGSNSDTCSKCQKYPGTSCSGCRKSADDHMSNCETSRYQIDPNKSEKK